LLLYLLISMLAMLLKAKSIFNTLICAVAVVPHYHAIKSTASTLVKGAPLLS
jgi:hypothetical protein